MSDVILFLKPASDALGRNIVRDFVYGCWCNGRRVGGMQMPPLNELYCATHVSNAGLTTLFLDAQYEPERYDALLRDRFSGIGAVVMLSSTQSFKADAELLSKIKEVNGTVKTVLFGSHPTFMPYYCLKSHAVDYIVLREPEETLRQLLLAIVSGRPVVGVEGVGYRDGNGEPVINSFRKFLEMDELPIPDRTLFPKGVDYFNPVVKRMPYTTMQTSRGCPGRCIFCTAPTFYGNKFRIRSSEKVLEELEIVKSQGYREVFFRDETFTAYHKRNSEICEGMIQKNLNLKWIANGRVDMINKDAMKLMKSAGCHMIKFGVESGSDEILQNYKKDISTEQTIKAFAMAHEVGLDTHAHIVLGGPGETRETILRTIDFARKIKATTASFGILTPYPGTELFDRVADRYPEIRDGSASTMENLHTQGFFSESVCGISGEELSRYIVKAYRSFYLRPRYLWDRFRGIESLEELLILFTAGMSIFQFSMTGEK